jgi:hypothetical protein
VRWRCIRCSGVVCVHGGKCSACGASAFEP